MVEKLKLTDEQRKAMDDILQQHREKLVDLRGSVEKAELELEPLMRDDQPNEAKILAQIDKVAQARAELEKGNARFLLAIRGKLLPEQRKELQAERTDRGQERHGFGAGGYGRQGGRDWKPGAQGPDGQKQGGQGRQAPAPPPGPQGMTNEDPGSDRPGSPAGGDIQ
jgi:Spy/CpxP family protein refolding chaperone